MTTDADAEEKLFEAVHLYANNVETGHGLLGFAFDADARAKLLAAVDAYRHATFCKECFHQNSIALAKIAVCDAWEASVEAALALQASESDESFDAVLEAQKSLRLARAKLRELQERASEP